MATIGRNKVTTNGGNHNQRHFGLNIDGKVVSHTVPCKYCSTIFETKPVTNKKSFGYTLAVCKLCHPKYYGTEVITAFVRFVVANGGRIPRVRGGSWEDQNLRGGVLPCPQTILKHSDRLTSPTKYSLSAVFDHFQHLA